MGKLRFFWFPGQCSFHYIANNINNHNSYCLLNNECANLFTHIHSLNSGNKLMGRILFPFYRWGKWRSEILITSPRSEYWCLISPHHREQEGYMCQGLVVFAYIRQNVSIFLKFRDENYSLSQISRALENTFWTEQSAQNKTFPEVCLTLYRQELTGNEGVSLPHSSACQAFRVQTQDES